MHITSTHLMPVQSTVVPVYGCGVQPYERYIRYHVIRHETLVVARSHYILSSDNFIFYSRMLE